jgi:hypothetical protein
VKVKGKWVTKTKHVRVPKKVTEQVTESVPGPPAPCYANGALASSAPSDYANYVFALQVLTHESIHLYDLPLRRPDRPALRDPRRVPRDAMVDPGRDESRHDR